MSEHILVTTDKKEEKFLRKKTELFDFDKFTRKEITDLLNSMKRAMQEANGIGLSANQIGLTHKVFVAKVPETNGGYKSYAVFNPKIEKLGSNKMPFEEGCLSVPKTYGSVERPDKITISGLDRNGKPLKIKAWGLLARVFQHEIDHLNGILFIDKAKILHKVENHGKK